jgi:ComF family protein
MGVLAPFSSLLDFILPPRAEALLVRAASSEALTERMQPRLIEMAGLPCVGLVPYRDPLMRAAVHEWKYRTNEKAATLLADLLAEYLLSVSDESWERAVIVPVPLSPSRMRERGFNQCEVVVRNALCAVDDPRITLDASLIGRVRDTEHQARLTRAARRGNVADAFAACGKADESLAYILFDDVITTGATMRAAAGALSAAGARRILPVALAY